MTKVVPDITLLQSLRCPICNKSMNLQGDPTKKETVTLYCHGERRHCYDLASSGYVNLMKPGYANGGDSKPAVRARSEFLNLDLYRPAAEALCEAVCRYVQPDDGILIDAGCGEGYYTAMLAKHGLATAGVDLSRFAVDATAKRMSSVGIPHAFCGVASVFEMPFEDACASAVVNVFAPCAEAEFTRVLRHGGILAVMYAGPEHLMGLKQALYDHTRENDGRADLPTTLPLVEEIRVRFDITVKGTQNLQNLFAMTPYYWKTSVSDSEKLLSMEELTTPVDMIIAIYQKP